MPAALDRRCNGNYSGDARFGRARQDRLEIRREIRVIEMGMGFDEHLQIRRFSLFLFRSVQVFFDNVDDFGRHRRRSRA